MLPFRADAVLGPHVIVMCCEAESNPIFDLNRSTLYISSCAAMNAASFKS